MKAADAFIQRAQLSLVPLMDGDDDTWLTPRWIMRGLGSFDLDPCAAESNPSWICTTSYTKRDDGLSKKWSGRVFCNPPFSNLSPWIEKHREHGRGITLMPASIESELWARVVWKHSSGVLLVRGRVKFSNLDGSATTGRPFRGIALVAWSLADAGYLSRSRIAGVFLDCWSLR